ncbi:MAG: aldehyde ferredoxin oxidoreductase N-terminal domain-containing protein, partial [Thermodesulfobacteriota bacterium]
MYGWRGRVLRVDLARGECKEENLDPQVAKDYIGGRGLGIYYLNKEANPKCDPLSPENMLIMAAGPLTGTSAPTAARYMVMTKGPLTGAVTCSNSGGHFPKELKLAINLDPNDPTPWLYSALLARELNRINPAIEELEHSVALN